MKRIALSVISIMTVTACSGDGDDHQPRPDGAIGEPLGSMDAIGPDALLGTAATVVDCAAISPDADFWYYSGVGFIHPTAALAVGDVVRFHDLESHTAWHDGGLWSATGNTELCVRFDNVGSFPWSCYFHPGDPGERGTITVQ